MHWQNDFDDLSLDNIERDRYDAGIRYQRQKFAPVDWDAMKARMADDADRMRRERVYMGWSQEGIWTKTPNKWLP